MPSEELFARTTPAMAAATDGAAWVGAMLAFEVALAEAEEEVGLLPAGAGARVRAAARAADVDVARVRSDGAFAGTVVVPLLAALAGKDDDLAAVLHVGATTQDVVDTALALVSRRAAEVLTGGLAVVAARLAALADHHRDTIMAGRTLLQHGSSTTFGLKAAGWLTSIVDAHDAMAAACERLPLQLGGAVGTLAALDAAGPSVIARLADRLSLPEPPLPWHTHRLPVAAVAAGLGAVAGSVAKNAGDLVLLSQTEVREVLERDEPGRGVSSAMAGKRNPVASVAAVAAARRAAPLAGALATAFAHEHERAAGAWQAEGPMLTDLFGLTALAVDAVADALDGLVVDPDRMRANLGDQPATDGPGPTAAVFIDRSLARYASSRLAAAK